MTGTPPLIELAATALARNRPPEEARSGYVEVVPGFWMPRPPGTRIEIVVPPLPSDPTAPPRDLGAIEFDFRRLAVRGSGGVAAVAGWPQTRSLVDAMAARIEEAIASCRADATRPPVDPNRRPEISPGLGEAASPPSRGPARRAAWRARNEALARAVEALGQGGGMGPDVPSGGAWRARFLGLLAAQPRPAAMRLALDEEAGAVRLRFEVDGPAGGVAGDLSVTRRPDGLAVSAGEGHSTEDSLRVFAWQHLTLAARLLEMSWLGPRPQARLQMALDHPRGRMAAEVAVGRGGWGLDLAEWCRAAAGSRPTSQHLTLATRLRPADDRVH